jgi:hypothetical protein
MGFEKGTPRNPDQPDEVVFAATRILAEAAHDKRVLQAVLSYRAMLEANKKKDELASTVAVLLDTMESEDIVAGHSRRDIVDMLEKGCIWVDTTSSEFLLDGTPGTIDVLYANVNSAGQQYSVCFWIDRSASGNGDDLVLLIPEETPGLFVSRDFIDSIVDDAQIDWNAEDGYRLLSGYAQSHGRDVRELSIVEQQGLIGAIKSCELKLTDDSKSD